MEKHVYNAHKEVNDAFLTAIDMSDLANPSLRDIKLNGSIVDGICLDSRTFARQIIDVAKPNIATIEMQKNAFGFSTLKASSVMTDKLLCLGIIDGMNCALPKDAFDSKGYLKSKGFGEKFTSAFSSPRQFTSKFYSMRETDRLNVMPVPPEWESLGFDSFCWSSKKPIRTIDGIVTNNCPDEKSDMYAERNYIPAQGLLTLSLKHAKGNKVFRIQTPNPFGLVIYAINVTLIEEFKEMQLLGKCDCDNINNQLVRLFRDTDWPLFFVVREERNCMSLAYDKCSADENALIPIRTFRCEHCGDLITAEKSFFRNGHRLCGYCANELIPVYKCAKCGKEFTTTLDEPFANVMFACNEGPMCASCYKESDIVIARNNGNSSFYRYGFTKKYESDVIPTVIFHSSKHNATSLDNIHTVTCNTHDFKKELSGNIKEGVWYYQNVGHESLNGCGITKCEHCGRLFYRGNTGTFLVKTSESDGSGEKEEKILCLSCAIELGVKTCGRCGRLGMPDEVKECHSSKIYGKNLCSECEGRMEVFEPQSFEQNGFVFNHFWKPEESVFHSSKEDHDCDVKDGKKKLYLGFELEAGGLATERTANAVAGALAKSYSDKLNIFFMKYDGSIPKHGFELVSQPITLSKHMKYKNSVWRKVLEFMKRNGMNFAELCGLHIHASRNFLNESQWSFVDWFISSTKMPWEVMSRRKANRYAQFNDKKTTSSGDLYEKFGKPSGDRYKVLNFENTNTVEFRIFRTTKDVDELIASLQLVDAVCRWAKTSDKCSGIIKLFNKHGKASSLHSMYDYFRQMAVWRVFMDYVHEHGDRYAELVEYEKKRMSHNIKTQWGWPGEYNDEEG